MQRKSSSRAVLMTLVVVASVAATWLSSRALSAQSSQALDSSLPMFEVDDAWPTVPAEWETRSSIQHRHRCPGQRMGFAPPGDIAARSSRDGCAAGHRVRYGRQFHQGLGRCGRGL